MYETDVYINNIINYNFYLFMNLIYGIKKINSVLCKYFCNYSHQNVSNTTKVEVMKYFNSWAQVFGMLLYARVTQGMVKSIVTSQKEGSWFESDSDQRPFYVHFAYFPHISLGFLQIIWFPQFKTMQVLIDWRV